MFTPIECSRPAPTWAASMIPSPAPVTTNHPDRAIALPNDSACRYAGEPAGRRADPNTVTLGRPRNTSKNRKA